MTLGLLDGPALAHALHIHPGTIRNWAHNGRLTRHGTDPKGRTLYSIQQALECGSITPRRSGRTMPTGQPAP